MRHLRRMLDPAILLLIAFVSVGLALAARAGLFGLPLAIILVSWFFKYAYALLDDVAFGAEQAPVLSLEMVNPVSQRPLGQVAIGLAAYATTLWTDGLLRTALIAAFVFAAPASVAILGASGRFVQAINPLAWLTVIRALGAYYAGLLAMAVVGAFVVSWSAASSIWPVLTLVAAQFVVLGVFNAIGAALYECRDRLDIDVLRSPERSAQRAEAERTRLRARMLDDVYSQARARKYAGIETTLAQWMDASSREELRTDALEIVRAILGWNDPRALAAVAPLCIMRLYDARLIGEALEAWELALRSDPHFRLIPVEKASALAELAPLAGKRALARAVVRE